MIRRLQIRRENTQLLAALNLGHHIADDLTIHPRPSAAHEWVDGAWVENKELSAEIKAATLDKARAGKLPSMGKLFLDFGICLYFGGRVIRTSRWLKRRLKQG